MSHLARLVDRVPRLPGARGRRESKVALPGARKCRAGTVIQRRYPASASRDSKRVEPSCRSGSPDRDNGLADRRVGHVADTV